MRFPLSSASFPLAGRRPVPVARQRGFSLLELAVAAALSALVAVWAASAWVARLDDAAAESVGTWLVALHAAAAPVVREIERAERGEAGQPLSPALTGLARLPVATLKALGHLEAGFPERSAWGAPARLELLRSQACPGAQCRIDLLLHTPVSGAEGRASDDVGRIGGVLLAARGLAGAIHPQAPGQLRGANFALPNPPAPGLAALPVGTVALHARGAPLVDDPYVRRRDTRDPDLQGPLTVAGAIHGGADLLVDGRMTGRGDLRIAGQVQGGEIVALGAISGAGVRSHGRLSSGEYLMLEAQAVPGSPCSSAGLVARDVSGALLACQQGTWRLQGGGFGGMFLMASSGHCVTGGGFKPNPVTGACSCPAGFFPYPVAQTRGGFHDEDFQAYHTYVCMP